jgi:hypothetical protein
LENVAKTVAEPNNVKISTWKMYKTYASNHFWSITITSTQHFLKLLNYIKIKSFL